MSNIYKGHVEMFLGSDLQYTALSSVIVDQTPSVQMFSRTGRLIIINQGGRKGMGKGRGEGVGRIGGGMVGEASKSVQK